MIWYHNFKRFIQPIIKTTILPYTINTECRSKFQHFVKIFTLTSVGNKKRKNHTYKHNRVGKYRYTHTHTGIGALVVTHV